MRILETGTPLRKTYDELAAVLRFVPQLDVPQVLSLAAGISTRLDIEESKIPVLVSITTEKLTLKYKNEVWNLDISPITDSGNPRTEIETVELWKAAWWLIMRVHGISDQPKTGTRGSAYGCLA